MSGNLTVGSSLGNLTPEFWAVNYNFQVNGFDNHTVASLLNQTPITWIRYPLGSTGYNYPPVWRQLVRFCNWIHCHSIATVGGPNTTAPQAAAYVQQAESLGVHPDFWVLGNEPNLWANETSIEYADTVYQWIQLVRQFDSSAKFIGVEISGNPRFGNDYIYNVTKVDGPYIQALAIQVYPQFGGNSVADFLKSLTLPTSVDQATENARELMEAACPSCGPIPLLLDEVNGGSGFNTNYIPFREQYPDVTFLAASMIQGLRTGLQQFAPWTFTAASSGPASYYNHCDFGMVQLLPGCDGEYLQPTYFLYENLLKRIPYGDVTNLSDSGVPGFFGVQVQNGTDRTLLLVNANPTSLDRFALGSQFPSDGTFVSFEMDPSHVSAPLVNASTVNGGGLDLSLSPLGVMVVKFSPTAQVALTITPPELTIGNSAQVNVTTTGATGPLTYSYPQLPPGCVGGNTSSFLCTPTEVGDFPASVVVSERGTVVGGSEANLTVAQDVAPPVWFYPVTFLERGLEPGTPWSVSVNGTEIVSRNSAEQTAEPNGTYQFLVGTAGNSTPSPSSGNLTVQGLGLVVEIQFAVSPINGSLVTFEAVGLSTSARWTLAVDGWGQTAGSTDVAVVLSLGMHSFQANATGYSANPAQGAIVSNGTPFEQRINFTVGGSAASPFFFAPVFGTLGAWLASPIVLAPLAATGIAGSGLYLTSLHARRARYRKWFEEEMGRPHGSRN